MNSDLLEQNKAVVRRFNIELIEQLNAETFKVIMHPDFINHTAAPGVDKGAAGIWYTFEKVLHTGLSNIKVTLYDQIAEGNKVTTRKTISGKHTGVFMGVPATQKEVVINVIDIVHVKDGQYFEHWGINTLGAVAAMLASEK